MKTFKEFQEQISLSQAFAKVGKPGGGVGDWESGTTTLSKMAKQNPQQQKTFGSGDVTLNKATYMGRALSGYDPKAQNNPDYVGPLGGTIGGSPGTRDVRMPGTTPSQNATKIEFLKKLSKTSRASNFI